MVPAQNRDFQRVVCPLQWHKNSYKNAKLGQNKTAGKLSSKSYRQGLGGDHKVHTYKEYRSVCPLVGTGTRPPPLSPASVHLPPEPRGDGNTSVRVRGWGSPNSNDWRKGLALCMPTLKRGQEGGGLDFWCMTKTGVRYTKILEFLNNLRGLGTEKE